MGWVSPLLVVAATVMATCNCEQYDPYRYWDPDRRVEAQWRQARDDILFQSRYNDLKTALDHLDRASSDLELSPQEETEHKTSGLRRSQLRQQQAWSDPSLGGPQNEIGVDSESIQRRSGEGLVREGLMGGLKQSETGLEGLRSGLQGFQMGAEGLERGVAEMKAGLEGDAAGTDSGGRGDGVRSVRLAYEGALTGAAGFRTAGKAIMSPNIRIDETSPQVVEGLPKVPKVKKMCRVAETGPCLTVTTPWLSNGSAVVEAMEDRGPSDALRLGSRLAALDAKRSPLEPLASLNSKWSDGVSQSPETRADVIRR